MEFETAPGAHPTQRLPGTAVHCTRARIRFRKTGDLRFVSHHDLMHCWERLFRRACLPLLSTRGFNPRPRLVFALSLALGIVGRAEVLEADLGERLSAAEILDRLAGQAPPGLELVNVRLVESNARAQVRRAFYRLPLPCPCRQAVEERLSAFLQTTSWPIRRSRPQPRTIDVRPFVSDLRWHDEALEMVFWVTPHGTIRPEEILQLLGLDAILQGGAIVERTNLELHDEITAGAQEELALPPDPAPKENSQQKLAKELSNKKGTGPICPNGPEGASHQLDLSPFFPRSADS